MPVACDQKFAGSGGRCCKSYRDRLQPDRLFFNTVECQQSTELYRLIAGWLKPAADVIPGLGSTDLPHNIIDVKIRHLRPTACADP